MTNPKQKPEEPTISQRDRPSVIVEAGLPPARALETALIVRFILKGDGVRDRFECPHSLGRRSLVVNGQLEGADGKPGLPFRPDWEPVDDDTIAVRFPRHSPPRAGKLCFITVIG